MWLLLLVLLNISPRLVIFILWLITNYLGQAFDGWFWPLMGFIFMPWTTLWCTYAYNNSGFTTGCIIILIICVLADLKVLVLFCSSKKN